MYPSAVKLLIFSSSKTAGVKNGLESVRVFILYVSLCTFQQVLLLKECMKSVRY